MTKKKPMLGPLVNSAALAIGAICGASLRQHAPERVKKAMPLTFAVTAIGIGTILANKVHALPAISLALIAGALIGELLYLEHGVERLVHWLQTVIGRIEAGDVR